MVDLYVLEVGDGEDHPRLAHIGEKAQCIQFAEQWCALFDDVRRTRDVGTTINYGNGKSRRWFAMVHPASFYHDANWFDQYIHMQTTIHNIRNAMNAKGTPV